MKGIFGPYVLWPFDKKLIFWIVTRVSARDYKVILFRGCNNNRRILIDQEQPNLCSTLEDFDEYFGINSTCDRWPNNYLEKFDGPNTTLRDELYEYGKQNLALIHVMIQSPYVTKIKRDVAMTFTSYVANTGGLLGLCLGFSFISLVEILFWVCCCLRQVKGWFYFDDRI